MKIVYALTLVTLSILITQCGQRVPHNVSQEEGARVLKLPPEKQVDAYLARIHQTKPPNYALAFLIAPNVDVRGSLAARIAGEQDDQILADLLFLAKIACTQQTGCSQDRKFADELRAACTRIHDPRTRSLACENALGGRPALPVGDSK